MASVLLTCSPPPLVVAAVVMGAGLLVLRVVLGGPRASGATRRAQSVAATHGAVVAAAICVSSAGVMSASTQAQRIIHSIDHPYRHTVVSWGAAAVMIVLALLALEQRRPATGRVGWAVGALTATLVAGALLPYNLAATRAARLDAPTHAVGRVYGELVLGDTSGPAADARRCTAAEDVRRLVNGHQRVVARRLLRGADLEFRRRFGAPYCSRGLTSR